jgi:intein/homing endonuclease
MFSKTNENKELYVCNDEPIYVYSEMGFIKVKKVIRHRTNKKLYRVSTDQGYVVVTEDHSMLSAAGDVLKPDECSVGTNLLTCNVHEMDISL